jgi:hypothetical protein
MQYLGINKGVERTDLQPGESPDAVNCFFRKGTLNLLGARKGKTFANSTAYDATVMGAPFLLTPSGGRYWMVAQTDGTADQTAAPQSSLPSGNPAASVYKWYSFGAPMTLTGAWLGTSTVTQTLAEPIPSGTYEMFLPRTFSISLEITGSGIPSEASTFGVFPWFKDAGGNVVSNLGNIFELANAGDDLLVAADSSTYLKSSLTLSATATQILIGVWLSLVWPATGDFTVGPFTGVLLRRRS